MIHFEHDDCCGHKASEATSENNTGSQDLLSTCKEKLAKTEEKLIYLAADFENFRRNVTKERAQWARTAQAKIFEGLLSVIDDLNRAVEDFKKLSDIGDAEKARFQGVELSYRNFLKFLEHHEVVEIATQGAFNPQLHEAVMQVEMPEKKSGDIVAVFQKGYMHKDAVLRPAKVSVAQ